MTRPTSIRPFFLAAAPLLAALSACKAFDSAPKTDLAIAADEAYPGYPRLADIPPEPEDVVCLRRLIENFQLEEESAMFPPSSLSDDPTLRNLPGYQQDTFADDLMRQSDLIAARNALRDAALPELGQDAEPGSYSVGEIVPRVPDQRYENLLSAIKALWADVGGGVGALSRGELFDGEDPEDADDGLTYDIVFHVCPPNPFLETDYLLAERRRLEEAAETLRAARPDGETADITLPEDMGAVARPGEGPEAGL